MSDPTLLICIGATKAGTTWLYQYLYDHPDCTLRHVKELHYFDTRAGRNYQFYLDHADHRTEQVQKKMAEAGFFARQKLRKELKDITAWRAVIADRDDTHRAYWRYITRDAGRSKLVADITPCYAILDRNSFREMASITGDVRFLFLLRDPVDRAWSQARMNGQRLAQKYNRKLENSIRRNFESFLTGGAERFYERSDYAQTLQEILSVIPREKLHIEFYEHMFSDEALRRLTDFMGIRPHPGALDKVSHKGTSLKITPDLVSRARAHLRDQYAFCNDFFDGQLPDRWRAHMAGE